MHNCCSEVRKDYLLTCKLTLTYAWIRLGGSVSVLVIYVCEVVLGTAVGNCVGLL